LLGLIFEKKMDIYRTEYKKGRRRGISMYVSIYQK
jgi:hypothetical protein